MRCIKDKIAVAVSPSSTTSKGGLYIPTQDGGAVSVGTVVAVGPEGFDEGLVIGNTVHFNKFNASKLSIDHPGGGEVYVIDIKGVLAVE